MNTKHSKINKSILIILTAGLTAFSPISPAQERLLGFSEEPVRLGQGQVASIAFSPDGTILFAAHRTNSSGDFYQANTVIYWDPQTQQQVGALPPHLVSAMALSPGESLHVRGHVEGHLPPSRKTPLLHAAWPVGR